MSLVACETGWTLEYIKNLPLYQVLQVLAFKLDWEGNELKWKSGGGDKERLNKILESF